MLSVNPNALKSIVEERAIPNSVVRTGPALRRIHVTLRRQVRVSIGVCSYIDTNVVITTESEKEVQGNAFPPLHLRWNRVCLLVKKENITMLKKNLLPRTCGIPQYHMPTRTQRKCELTTVMSVCRASFLP